jgi:hypothetical protein
MRIRIDGVKSVRVVEGDVYQWLEIEDEFGAYVSYFLTGEQADMLADALARFPGRSGVPASPVVG